MATMTARVRKPREIASEADDALVAPLRESPSFLVRLVQLAAFDEFHRQFAGLAMTPGRFSAFCLVARNPGIRPGALSEELRVKPSNIAVLVNALVADGLVERRQDKTELRASKLYPTRRGQHAFKEFWAIHCDLDAQLLSPLSATERRVFVQLLGKLVPD